MGEQLLISYFSLFNGENCRLSTMPKWPKPVIPDRSTERCRTISEAVYENEYSEIPYPVDDDLEADSGHSSISGESDIQKIRVARLKFSAPSSFLPKSDPPRSRLGTDLRPHLCVSKMYREFRENENNRKQFSHC